MIKKLDTLLAKGLISVLIAVGGVAEAKYSQEFLFGSATYHLIGGGKKEYRDRPYSGDSALILNGVVAYRQVAPDKEDSRFYTSEMVFFGNNSIKEPMGGYVYSAGGSFGGSRLGLLAGIYLQNNGLFLAKGIIPPMLIPYDGIGPVPIVGIEFVHKITRAWLLNTAATPGFVIVGVGYEF